MSVTAGAIAPETLRRLVRVALDEDLGGDPGTDLTTVATVAEADRAVVEVRARAAGVLAGQVVWGPLLTDAARRTAQDPPVVELLADDGAPVRPGDVVARLTGPTRALLVAERSGLNLAGRASGIATHTHRWVQVLAGTGVQVLDTRKTTPGLRAWEKYAVRCGGGVNKRVGLFDTAMVKDNHASAAGSVVAAYRAVRSRWPDAAVEVEVESTADALAVVRAGGRYLMCDNMDLDALAATVRAVRDLVRDLDGPDGRVEVEATGGLSLDRVRDVAATGVDHVSVGALTHSSPQLDLGLDWVG
ncbi:carboxylating nicotinate-nucleotide diphosphorylase [Aquipuribacter nitratireducens]|uniref:nicotinate-nucleotide diphosphorylase (carboxylating) n=1 Tax=Aquipuribacter nitratireducens TaxID=650104 RepID=A0ABW0GTJ4_9MICO